MHLVGAGVGLGQALALLQLRRAVPGRGWGGGGGLRHHITQLKNLCKRGKAVGTARPKQGHVKVEKGYFAVGGRGGGANCTAALPTLLSSCSAVQSAGYGAAPSVNT